jgi:1-acyl-sn-glycerol-3-phosphate acyltransferase
MRIAFHFINAVARYGTSILCRINRAPLKLVPRNGPLIIAVNHIGSLEVPLMFAHLQPRKMTGLAKIETWDSKFMGWLFTLWGAIPVRRGEVDMDAIRGCLDVLKAGNILALAPEGTRSYDGKLLPGQPGIALIALRTGAPILPMAHWGGEKFSDNLKHWKRTDFHIGIGKAFRLEAGNERVTGEVRQAMADEIMCEIAALMPEEYRGVYKGKCNNPPKYIKFV